MKIALSITNNTLPIIIPDYDTYCQFIMDLTEYATQIFFDPANKKVLHFQIGDKWYTYFIFDNSILKRKGYAGKVLQYNWNSDIRQFINPYAS
jgi:hypothetical protein